MANLQKYIDSGLDSLRQKGTQLLESKDFVEKTKNALNTSINKLKETSGDLLGMTKINNAFRNENVLAKNKLEAYSETFSNVKSHFQKEYIIYVTILILLLYLFYLLASKK